MKDMVKLDVECIINTSAFGTLASASQWTLPTTDHGNELDSITFTNWRVRKVMKQITQIAHAVIKDEHRRNKWISMLELYIQVMKIATKREDFTDEEIEDFQDLIDFWFYQYISLVGIKGVTNYMHLLGAGHLCYYLKKWRSLYRFEQQGWESKNGVMSTFYNKRTWRGGASGKHGPSHTSRVEPIMQWFQRVYLWTTGEADVFFNHT